MARISFGFLKISILLTTRITGVFYELKYDEDPKELSFELIRTDEKSVMPDIRTLDARECLAFAESILEEEKGELPL